MSTPNGEWSYCVEGKDPWERTRHFNDGSDPILEWQCSDCAQWYPLWGTTVVMGQSFSKGTRSWPWCSNCRPPKSGLLKHLHDGGACIIGFNDSHNPWKRWAEMRNKTG